MPPDPLLDRLRRLPWPEPARDQPEPEAGQLWRAVWQHFTCLVVTLEPARDRKVAVAPATVDDAGDDRTVMAETSAGFSPLVWAGLSAGIKLFTLEHRIADLTPESLAAVLDAVAGKAPPRWAPIEDVLDDRALIRAELIDGLQALVDAEWLRPLAHPISPPIASASTVPAPSQVARILGITPGDARRLLQGLREPTPAEAERLTALLGAPPSMGAAFDEDLIVDMDSPEFRPMILHRADQDRAGDEAAARRALAGEMMAMAARQRGPGRRNWKALLRDALRSD